MWESLCLLTDAQQFTVQNLGQLVLLISFDLKTTCSDVIQCVESDLKPK